MKRINYKLLLTLAAAIASLGVRAQDAGTAAADTLRLSAAECVQIALSTNPTIKVADMEVKRVSYSKNLSVAQLLPTVSFTGQYSRALALQTLYMDAGDGNARAIKMGQENSYSTGFTASVPLIAPQLWKSLKLNDNEIEQNIETARASRLQMANQVPADIPGQHLVFLAELLYLIFTEIPGSSRKQLFYHGHRLGLAHRNQRHLVSGTPCPGAGLLYMFFHFREIFHYHTHLNSSCLETSK